VGLAKFYIFFAVISATAAADYGVIRSEPFPRCPIAVAGPVPEGAIPIYDLTGRATRAVTPEGVDLRIRQFPDRYDFELHARAYRALAEIRGTPRRNGFAIVEPDIDVDTQAIRWPLQTEHPIRGRHIVDEYKANLAKFARALQRKYEVQLDPDDEETLTFHAHLYDKRSHAFIAEIFIDRDRVAYNPQTGIMTIWNPL
jgi:hypothetical protein